MSGHNINFLRDLTLREMAAVVALLIVWRLLIVGVRWIARVTAERSPPERRLLILRASPLIRLAISLTGIALLLHLLVEPNVEDVIALIATASVLLAFALKDHVSSLFAGVVTIVENAYQPGDWIELDGSYGEVRSIGARAVHLVTVEDREVIIPHSRLWSAKVLNVSQGRRFLMCTANFYLHPNHDGGAVRQALAEIAEASRFREPGSVVRIAAAELPWGTRYRIRAYVAEGREQFAMVTELTLQGKERLRQLGVTFAQAPYAEVGAAE